MHKRTIPHHQQRYFPSLVQRPDRQYSSKASEITVTCIFTYHFDHTSANIICMAPHALPRHQSTPSLGWKWTSNKTKMHYSDPISSTTYDNAKTAANRAFLTLDGLSSHNTSNKASTRSRKSAKRKRGTGAGSHFAKHRSQEFARKARRTRSSDLPRASRSSCGTPSTDLNPRYSASDMSKSAQHSTEQVRDASSPTSSKDKTHRRSPTTKILAKCRSALSVASLYKAGEKPRPTNGTPDRDVRATPTSQASGGGDVSPTRHSEGDLLQRARDQYLQEYRTGVVRKKRSIIPVFSRTVKKEPSNVFSSTAETVCEVVSQDPGPQLQSKLSVSEKAKRVSRSVKKKMSKIFHFSPKRKQGMLPQQIDSPHIHFGSGNMTQFRNFSGSHILGHDTHESYNNLLRKISPFTLNSNEYDKDARIFSIPDGAVQFPNKSRVTSWNDSSERSTLGQPGGRLLSVVQEQDEVSSRSSFHAIQEKEQTSRSPRKFPVHLRRSKPESSPPADIRRLFAAVQQRIQNSDFNGSQIDVADLLDDLENEEKPRNTTVRVNPSAMRESEASQPAFQNTSEIDRRELVSPSIYSSHSVREESERPSGKPTLFVKDTCRQKGTAWIDESRSVVRHEFQKRSPPNHEAPIMTSNEWRAWTSGEISDLSKRVTSLHLGSCHQPPPLFSGTGVRTASPSHGSPTSRRPPDTPMNDRFPIIGGVPNQDSTNSSSLSLPKLTYGAHPAAYIRSNNRDALVSLQKSNDNLSGHPNRTRSDDIERIKHQNQPCNTAANPACGQYEAHHSQTSMNKPAQARKSVDNVLAEKVSPFMDDNVLRAIRKGPYASPSPVPSLSSSDQDSPIKIPKRRQIHRDIENVSPLNVCSSKQMVEDFLKSRLGDKENQEQTPNSSPPAYV